MKSQLPQTKGMSLTIYRFCIEVMSVRTMQHATEELFKAVSQYAQDVPIIIVATKMDESVGAMVQKHRTSSKKLGQTVTMDECDQYAEDRLRERVDLMKKEMLNVNGGRLDACVAISRGKVGSISS